MSHLISSARASAGLINYCGPKASSFLADTYALDKYDIKEGEANVTQAAGEGVITGAQTTSEAVIANSQQGVVTDYAPEEKVGSSMGISNLITGEGMHFDPESRMVFYGVAGGLLTANALFFVDTKEKYDKEVEACQDMLDTLEDHDGDGNDTSGDGTTGGANSGTTSTIATQGFSGSGTGVDGYQNTSCYVGDPASPSGLTKDDSCGCLKVNACAKVEGVADFQPVSGVDFAALPPVAADAAQATENMANGVTNDDLAGATAAANDLVNNAARIRKFHDDAQKAYNKARVNAGKPPIDFKKAHDLMKRSLIQGARNDLKAGNPAFKNAMRMAPPKVKKRYAKKSKSYKRKIIPKATGKKMNFGGRRGFGNKGFGAKKKLGDTDAADALKGLDYKVADISNNTGASIFKMITSRYIRTAYPIFFDKKKVVPTGPESKKKKKKGKK